MWHGAVTAADKRRAKLRDMVTRGHSAAPEPELLRESKHADAIGLRNSLDVQIALVNFPRGTRFAQKAKEPAFRQIAFNRGVPMALDSQTS